jgi:hypothetical protein
MDRMVGMAKVNQKDTEMILEIEQNLQHMLRPVKPRADFVARLENRLVTPPQINIEKRPSFEMFVLVFSAITLLIPITWIVWRYGIKKLLN